MSQIPKPKISYKHTIDNGLHIVRLYNGNFEYLVESGGKSIEEAIYKVGIELDLIINSKIDINNKKSLRQIFMPSKKIDGYISISSDNWRKITHHDFINGHIGIITQAELGRIRGVSRQAINQSVNRGDVEIFMWRDEKYIPFDTISVNPYFYEQVGNPMVIFYSEGGKSKKPRRRFKKET